MKPKLFSVYAVQMRSKDRGVEPEPAADFLVVTDTLQEAIDFAAWAHPNLEITAIRLTDEQVFYGARS